MSRDFHIDKDLVARYAPATDEPPQPVPFNLNDPWLDDPGLSAQVYDELEARGSARLAPPLVTAFRPLTFEQFGFPTRIRVLEELLRYADWNFEYYGARLFEPGATFHEICFVNAFTRSEWALISGLGHSISCMTKARTGQAVRPITTLMNAITPLRIIHALASKAPRSLTVFEVGSGMAYLGPLLVKLGHRYRSFDVTQAFYLWQHHMLRWTTGRDFVELASEREGAAFPDSAVVNVPWWRYANFRFGQAVPQADIVYSSSNLCEMTNEARRCMLETSHKMLSASSMGALFFIGPGAQAQCSAEQLMNEIVTRGFHRVENVPIYIWTATAEAAKVIERTFGDLVPFYSPDGDSRLYPASLVTRIPRTEAPIDVPYAKWATGWEPNYLD